MTRDEQIKWAEALESGEYKQYRGAWLWADEYCCLSVFLLAVLNDLQEPYETFKLEACIAEKGIDAEYYMVLNDEDELSFEQIAMRVRRGEGIVLEDSP